MLVSSVERTVDGMVRPGTGVLVLGVHGRYRRPLK